MKRFLISLTLAAIAASASPVRADDSSGPSTSPAEGEKPNPAQAESPPKPRQSSLDLGLVMVPWGMHYTRAGAGVTLGYSLPLVKKHGVLWDSTNITFGVRNFYGFVNNTFGPFIEITPIAVFKLRVEAAYDYFVFAPFNGGLRVLTSLGLDRLARGLVERGNTSAIDWSGDAGVNNTTNFLDPINIGGGRLRVMPTLQGKVGPIVFQYNFMADFNLYTAPGARSDDVFHDTFTFTLRKLHDVSQTHELFVAYTAPIAPPGELILGVSGRYNRVFGTGLDQFALNAVIFARLPRKIIRQRVSPFAGVQAGTLLIDPMWQYAFSWVTVVGADINLHKSKPYYIPADKP